MAPFHWLDEILRLPITDYRLIVDPALDPAKKFEARTNHIKESVNAH